MLHFITGRAGSGKTEYIHRLIDRNIKNKNYNNILIVPDQFSFETERAIIRRNPANSQAGLCEITSFSRLCDRIFKEYGGLNGTRIDNASRALIMAMCIDEVKDNLSVYKKASGYPEFVNLMLSSITEFKSYDISPDQLIEVSSKVNSEALKLKLREISLIYSAFEATKSAKYSDPMDDLETATLKAAENCFFAGKTIFIDAFYTFTKTQLKLLEVIISQADEVYISLCLDSLQTKSEYDIFFETKDTFRSIKSIADKHAVEVSSPVILSENLRAKNGTIKKIEAVLSDCDDGSECDGNNLIIYNANNRYDEAEFVAANICRLNREKGLRYRKIAVIARNIGEYSGIIDSVFKRYDIPYFIDSRRPLNHQPLMLMVSSLLKLFDRVSTETIVSIFKTGLTDITLEELSAFENYCFLWGINGSDILLKHFTLNPKGPDRSFDKEGLEQLENTRRKIASKLNGIKEEVSSGSKASDFAKAVFNFILDCNADKHLRNLADTVEKEGDIDSAEDLRRSYEIFVSSLDTLVSTAGDKDMSIKDFCRLYNILISSCDMGSLPQGIDEVPLASATRFRPSNPQIVFILGANQDVFPAAPSGSGVLTDRDRIILNNCDLHISNPVEQGSAKENFMFYTSVCCASDEVYITYSCSASDDDSSEASSPVENLISAIPDHCNGIVFFDDNNGTKLPCSFDTDAFAQRYLAENYRSNTPLSNAIKRYFSAHPSNGFNSMLFAEHGIDINIQPDTAILLFGKDLSISPTAMENFYKCGFSYFCQSGLRARALKPFSVSSQLRGTLVHLVLEKAVRTFGGQNLKNIPDDELAAFTHKIVEEYITENICEKDDLTAVQKFDAQRVETTALAATKHVATEYANTEFENLACELRVNSASQEFEPIIIPLKSGGTVTMSGVIDRVDVFKKDGKAYLRIIDYKTGKKKFYLADLYYGIGLQPFFYLKSIIDGKILKDENVVPAGVFYMHAARKMVKKDDIANTSEDLETKLNETAGLSGIILKDPDVITAMTGDGISPFFKLEYEKNGELKKKSNAATLEFFHNVGELTVEILREMGNKLQRGLIDHIPFDPTDKTACDYCDFKNSMCPYKGVEHKKPKKIKTEEAFEIKEGADFDEFFSD